MTPIPPERLFAALDATWAPLRIVEAGPWRVRVGAGGGQRVSSATATGPVTAQDITTAEAAQAALGQPSLFMIRQGEEALDHWLEMRGYAIVDPVRALVAPVGMLAETPPGEQVYTSWPPLQIQIDLWAGAGIGPGRIAVMNRVEGAKAALLGRAQGRPVAVAFVACDGEIAMLHSLEVLPSAKRRGMGRMMMRAAADWAGRQGATMLAVMVTRANLPGNALYRSLGMVEQAEYHYRRAREAG